MNRIKAAFSSLVPGNTVDSVIKQGRARGRRELRGKALLLMYLGDLKHVERVAPIIGE